MSTPYIETYSGVRFTPLDPVAADIRIDDIAHALSNQCRFSGHVRTHYSVAEHSVRVADLLAAWGESKEVQLWGLLHDASEAYLVDIPAPLKQDPRIGQPYREAEAKCMAVVCERFGLPVDEPPIVRKADMVLLATEARDLMYFRRDHWGALTEAPLDERVEPWGAEAAELSFVVRFLELKRARAA